ncbi:Protein STG-2 b [Aphelenchoides avenae]|nr:Protein STG-2 b [Aphelenchus avenae]
MDGAFGGPFADLKRAHGAAERREFSNPIVSFLVNTRCTETSTWAASSAIGLLLISMQIVPIFLLNWVHVTEPRAISRLDDKGDPLEIPFTYNAGYLGMCRRLTANLTAIGIENQEEIYDQNPPVCVWNPAYTGEELSDFSLATSAILGRLTVPAAMHVGGTILCVLAFLLGVVGQLRTNAKTLASAIFYVLGGLVVLTGVLQLICVVDDEMYPRMKPNASGEPSTFRFKYGASFMAAALSFLPVQLCAYLQTSIYFNRFPSATDKASIVPGLGRLLHEVMVRARSGRHVHVGAAFVSGPPPGQSLQRRRESRASKDFSVSSSLMVQQEVPCLQPPLTEALYRPSSPVCLC